MEEDLQACMIINLKNILINSFKSLSGYFSAGVYTLVSEKESLSLTLSAPLGKQPSKSEMTGSYYQNKATHGRDSSWYEMKMTYFAAMSTGGATGSHSFNSGSPGQGHSQLSSLGPSAAMQNRNCISLWDNFSALLGWRAARFQRASNLTHNIF